ncbi:UNVERIFIED_CONTAM: hypothetical protein Sradi_2959700 [Sesamum radiatum]|uniref:Transposase n=1 Tax=Sesamum radiatum TaxID=300843 RepID=A0AAW2S0P9_SESRA
MESGDHEAVFVAIQEFLISSIHFLNITYHIYRYYIWHKRRRQVAKVLSYNLKTRIPDQVKNLRCLTGTGSGDACLNNLRMSVDAFCRLCYLLEQLGGLKATRNVPIAEQVAIFLNILAHHTKNRVVKYNFKRSGRTISKHFHAVLKLHPVLLATPTAGCLGVLDGTYIHVKVPEAEKGRYWNRKGDISVNVLGVCDRDMKFIYVLTGWEGSAADSRVLRDAINRHNGLKVPTGNYYLCDNGYTNGDGFLTPYRGVRYHLKEWETNQSGPQNHQELYNMSNNSRTEATGYLSDFKLSHRVWSVREEEGLIAALKDIVKQGWKCDNGFRTGYLGVLEQEMVKLFPSSDIKADPHIQSKIHVWKKTYGSIVSMLTRSGFGWNDATNMVVVDDDVWENYVKVDPFVKNMRLKSFPFYPAWCEVFGKDRATGEFAEDIGDVTQPSPDAE